MEIYYATVPFAMWNYFLAATALASAVYLLMTLRQRPRSDTPVRKVCWNSSCQKLHDEPGNYCAICQEAYFPCGITWVYYQQEIDEIRERLR